MKAPDIIGRGFLRPAAKSRHWTEHDLAALQAGLSAMIGKHGLGAGRIVIDGTEVRIEIAGALEPEEVVILQKWLEVEAARIERS